MRTQDVKCEKNSILQFKMYSFYEVGVPTISRSKADFTDKLSVLFGNPIMHPFSHIEVEMLALLYQNMRTRPLITRQQVN